LLAIHLSVTQGGSIIRHPIFGINFSTTSLIQYRINDVKTKSPVLEEKVKAVQGAKFNDAFYGVTRLRMAIEASVKKNIATFMQKLESENS
jgi:hypothetical protein